MGFQGFDGYTLYPLIFKSLTISIFPLEALKALPLTQFSGILEVRVMLPTPCRQHYVGNKLGSEE